MKSNINFYMRKFLKEWLLLASIIATLSTSFYLKKIPAYSKNDFEILFILFILFSIIKGLENSNFFAFVGKVLEKEKFLHFKLILITIILSMFVTNDVALLIIVPLTLSLNITSKGFIVILETLAANAGSAFTPFGNPQNIFIYWYYNLNFISFFKTIFYFSFFSIIIILFLAFFIKYDKIKKTDLLINKTIKKECFLNLLFLLIMILIIFHLIPIYFSLIPFFFYLFFKRENLNIDYILIATFFFFFGFTDNLKTIFDFKLSNPHQVFLFSALLSQFISNVPSALLFSDFTHNWKALLWGVNVGGYGNLIGSLANLIAYRIYINYKKEKFYALKFTFFGYLMFFATFLLYFFLNNL